MMIYLLLRFLFGSWWLGLDADRVFFAHPVASRLLYSTTSCLMALNMNGIDPITTSCSFPVHVKYSSVARSCPGCMPCWCGALHRSSCAASTTQPPGVSVYYGSRLLAFRHFLISRQTRRTGLGLPLSCAVMTYFDELSSQL